MSLTNVIYGDPLFADTTNCRLQSASGRWTGSGWVNDTLNSPCIDAGAVGDVYANEPAPNGGRINLGWDGNTIYTSKSDTSAVPVVVNQAPTCTNTTAALRGQLTSGGASQITFYYGTTDGGTTPGSWAASVTLPLFQTNGAVFQQNITGLNQSQTYYVTCYATNALGSSWASPSLSFATGGAETGGGVGIVHVNKIATNGVQNGSNWNNAFTTILAALNSPTATNEIWIAAGNYYERGLYVANNNVGVYGGFAGTETLRSQRNWTNNITAVDGQTAASETRLMTVAGTNVTVDGVRFVNMASYTYWYALGYGTWYGGAFYGAGNGLTLSHCTFTSNLNSSTTAAGGALALGDIQAVVNDCGFYTNYMTWWITYGGALSINSTKSIVITNCAFGGNYISNNDAGHLGGAIYKTGTGTVDIVNSTFVSNKINHANTQANDQQGGAIYAAQGVLNLRNCTMYTNTVSEYGMRAKGGAIYVANGATVWIKNSILWNNNAFIYTNQASATNGNSIFVAPGGILTNSYSCFNGTNSPSDVSDTGGGGKWGSGIITTDPLFALTTSVDVHEKAQGGRWNPTTRRWVRDGLNSPCIDAGDPTGDFSREPRVNTNFRVNMGAYGNTPEASFVVPVGTVYIVR